ncbi:MAG: cytidylate kinase-like family protein [Deltaproteobacteria bacterium]|nr:MAG: cytidylate kinase-like family protein [Deltaproteobacteria bacterium]
MKGDSMAVITVSRQFGAGGKTLGKMISSKMEYSLVDNEIIQMVATKAKVSTNWVESIEKEAGGKFLKFISGVVPKSLVDRVLDDKRGYIDEEIYVDSLRTIISKIADEGNTIIIGRGGQYILKDQKNAFHLLLIGEKDDRVKFMESHYDLTTRQATQAVEMDDKRRINLYRKFGKKDYDHPDLYHLVLNMSKVSLKVACEVVCKLVEAQGAEDSPSETQPS